MKSLPCERCQGTGLYKNLGSCIQCRGAGVLTEDRLLNLRDEYWPRRIAEETISPVAGHREIAEIERLLQRLRAAPDEPIVVPVLVSEDQPRTIEIDDLLSLLGNDVGWTSSLLTIMNKAKKKGLRGRITFVEEN